MLTDTCRPGPSFVAGGAAAPSTVTWPSAIRRWTSERDSSPHCSVRNRSSRRNALSVVNWRVWATGLAWLFAAFPGCGLALRRIAPERQQAYQNGHPDDYG